MRGKVLTKCGTLNNAKKARYEQEGDVYGK